MRKLASIQLIKDLKPIEGADAIECATILGWEVVVKKGEFKVGDKCVYIEIDSIVPDKSMFEFLRDRKFRIRTIKLKKQISQGIAFPVSILKDFDKKFNEKNYAEGKDITDIMGIVKYDPQLKEENDMKSPIKGTKNPIIKFMFKIPFLRGFAKSFLPKKETWPNFITKTDEERIQTIPEVLNSGTTCYITEKLDGQSATYFINKGKFGVCSRNIYLKTPTPSNYWNVAINYNLERKMKALKKNIYIQGEILAPGVRGNKYGMSQPTFFIFTAVDINKNKFFTYEEMKTLADTLGVNIVPYKGMVTLNGQTVEDFLVTADNKSAIGDCIREGIVIRDTSTHRSRLSFKAISRAFELKYKE